MSRDVLDEIEVRLASILQPYFGGEAAFSAVQIAVKRPDGPLRSWTFGPYFPGLTLSTSHIFNVYCATKPVVAMILMSTLEAHGFTLSDGVSALVQVPQSLVGLRWLDVLNHSAGLVSPTLLEFSLRGNRSTRQVIVEAIRSSPTGYSEVTAAALMTEACERLEGVTFSVLADDWLARAGLGGGIRFVLDDDVLRSPLETVGCYCVAHRGNLIPMLHDATPGIGRAEGAVGITGYASAQGLCAFYDGIASLVRGKTLKPYPSPRFFGAALGTPRGSVQDATLQRTCDFAAGLMIDLKSHGFDSAGRASVGHAGVHGSPFGLYDDERGLSVGCIINAFGIDPAALGAVRRDILEAVSDA